MTKDMGTNDYIINMIQIKIHAINKGTLYEKVMALNCRGADAIIQVINFRSTQKRALNSENIKSMIASLSLGDYDEICHMAICKLKKEIRTLEKELK